MRFWQRCTASSLAIPTSGLVPARSCLACRLAVDLEVCRAVVCRIAGRRVHQSPQAAAPAATPSAQRVGSASCMSRYRPIRASCFAAGAGHPAPGLPAEPRQTPILEKASRAWRKKAKTRLEKVKKGVVCSPKSGVCSPKKGKRETIFVKKISHFAYWMLCRK